MTRRHASVLEIIAGFCRMLTFASIPDGVPGGDEAIKRKFWSYFLPIKSHDAEITGPKAGGHATLRCRLHINIFKKACKQLKCGAPGTKAFHYTSVRLTPANNSNVGVFSTLFLVPPERGFATALRLGWLLRIPQMWISSAHNFWFPQNEALPLHFG